MQARMIALVAREPFAPIRTAPPALPPLLSAIRLTSGVRTGGLETWPCPYCGALHLHDGGTDPEFAPYGLHAAACQDEGARRVNTTGYVLVPPRFVDVATAHAARIIDACMTEPQSVEVTVALGFARRLLGGGKADGWTSPDGPVGSVTTILRWSHWLSTRRTQRWFDLAAKELRADAAQRCWHAVRLRFHGNLAWAFAETGLTPHHDVAEELLSWHLPWQLPACSTQCQGEVATVAAIKRITDGTTVPKPSWMTRSREPRKHPDQHG